MQSQDAEKPSTVLKRLIDGYQLSQAIHVAATLGIADLLNEVPLGVGEIALAVDAHEPSLYRVMRALAAAGVFHESDDRQFSLTPVGECLRSDSPDPVAPWAAFIGQSYQWEAWGHLIDGVRTGENAFRLTHGMGVWEYRSKHPELGSVFDQAMTGNSRRQNAAILAAFDFSRFRRVVDVGGGQGALLAGILARNPEMHGILFDQPHVVARAEPLLQEAGVAERCRVVSGDFFHAVPAGGDAYLLKIILHDWDDERALAILRVCRDAIAPNGTLLVIEHGVEPPNEGLDEKLMDLRMLIGPGGQERTRDEYDRLLAAAGFRLIASHDVNDEVRVIEARPV